jgi:3-hydroxyacyl-CoA dehydrogenase/enoyl-CoA hydratase/3-hydroxybutyryl-CoA epimerase
MTEQSTIRYDLASDGVVTLTLDDPGANVNTMNDAYVASMATVLDQLEADLDRITGVIVTSAKTTFFAGADLKAMIQAGPNDAQEMYDEVELVKSQFRRLELLERPVVAAINGTALGGGLEIALACHHRIAVDDNRIQLGFPEVTLGLLPGAGGVTRTVRMFGLQDALMNILLQGTRMKPAQAKAIGLVDDLVSGPDNLIIAARSWILEHQSDSEAASQPWDRPGYRMPGGTPASPKLATILPSFPANLRKQLKGAPYPAPRAILAAAVEGSQVDFDTATRIESRYLVSLATGPIAKNMIRAFFFDLQHINAGGSRPAAVPAYNAKKVAVLGAGMMGAGIAYECARSGMEVVLKDVSVEAAAKGKAHSAALLDKQLAKGRISSAKRDDVLDRITPTADSADVAGCDLVIEAVFESAELKQRVFAEIEELVEPDALLASNTSTLPITDLATGVRRQPDFIGLHFFSPVDRMPLVEIIKGRQTSDVALAKAVDVVRQIKKTPIVVNDSRGFFTSRVFGTLVLEAAAMVGEGINPVTIERAATQQGFPAPPLAMIDEVTLTLPQKIRAEAKAAAETEGNVFAEHPGTATIDRMVDEFGRRGKSSGAGFYDYPAAGPKHLWPGLWDHFVDNQSEPDFRDLQERFTFAMSLETVKCLAEGVLTSVPDANIGSIMGIGFPPLYGGALQYINGYAGGVAGFAARAGELSERYGDRFDPPELLVEKAAAGARFS